MPTGTARWRVFLGAGGRPASAATIGVLAIALAGREAAKYVAATARTMEMPMTVHGSWNAPITWCALFSACGR